MKRLNKEFIDDKLKKTPVLRFNQISEKYTKISVGDTTYNLSKYDKIHLTDTKTFKVPNSGGYIFQQ